MADAIFISYRRDDSEGEAGRLFDDLTRAFGNDAVFMDVTGIKPGVDFREAIESNVAVCGVFLAVVGPTWATIKNLDGVRRLDDPKDFVALELASALSRKVPVIPVLVHDAKMPIADLLPEQLKSFSFRNSVELSHTRWSSDVQLLIQALKPYISPPTNQPPQPIHATVPVQLPPPRPASYPAVPPVTKSRTPLILGISGAVLLVLVLLGIIGTLSNKEDTKPLEANTMAPSSTPANASTPNDQSQSQSQPQSEPQLQNQPQPAHQQVVLPTPASAQTTPGTGSFPPPGFVGNWTSPVPRVGNSLQRLVISVSGDTLFMHPYGNCQSPECDWGEQPVLFQGAAATSVFHISPAMEADGSTTQRVVQIVATPAHGRLNLDLRNQYQNTNLGPLSKIYQVTLVPQD